MVVSNRNLLFQGSIFRGYVSFREGTPNNQFFPRMFGDFPTIFYIKIWNHLIETTIYKWLVLGLKVGIYSLDFWGVVFSVKNFPSDGPPLGGEDGIPVVSSSS